MVSFRSSLSLSSSARSHLVGSRTVPGIKAQAAGAAAVAAAAVGVAKSAPLRKPNNGPPLQAPPNMRKGSGGGMMGGIPPKIPGQIQPPIAPGGAIGVAGVRAFSSTTTPSSSSNSEPTPNKVMSVKETVENHIKEGHVVVFSKSYCPYCKASKQLLESLNANAKVFELDQMDEGADWQAYLGDKTGQRTVPSIFIDGEFIGGNSDLQSANSSGKLAKLIKQ